MSPRESALLQHMPSTDFPGVESLRRQAETARVIGRCDCGCPSIDLSVDEPVDAPTEPGRKLIGGFMVEVPTNPYDPVFGIILHIEDGRLRLLELYWHVWHEDLREFPEPEQVRLEHPSAD